MEQVEVHVPGRLGLGQSNSQQGCPVRSAGSTVAHIDLQREKPRCHAEILSPNRAPHTGPP